MTHAAHSHPRTIAWTGLQDAFDNGAPGAAFTALGLANEALSLTGHRPSEATTRRFLREALAGKIHDTGRTFGKAHVYRIGQPPAKAEPNLRPDNHSIGLAMLEELNRISTGIEAVLRHLYAGTVQRAG